MTSVDGVRMTAFSPHRPVADVVPQICISLLRQSWPPFAWWIGTGPVSCRVGGCGLFSKCFQGIF